MPHTLEERQAPLAKSDYNEFCFHLKVQSADLFSVEMRMLRSSWQSSWRLQEQRGTGRDYKGKMIKLNARAPACLAVLETVRFVPLAAARLLTSGITRSMSPW